MIYPNHRIITGDFTASLTNNTLDYTIQLITCILSEVELLLRFIQDIIWITVTEMSKAAMSNQQHTRSLVEGFVQPGKFFIVYV